MESLEVSSEGKVFIGDMYAVGIMLKTWFQL